MDQHITLSAKRWLAHFTYLFRSQGDSRFEWQMVNGERVECKEYYTDIMRQVQEFQFSVTLHALPLTGLDVVLGIQWLKKLKLVLSNWGKLMREIQWKGCTYVLRGQHNRPVQHAALHTSARNL